jgi:hypothetical protein
MYRAATLVFTNSARTLQAAEEMKHIYFLKKQGIDTLNKISNGAYNP